MMYTNRQNTIHLDSVCIVTYPRTGSTFLLHSIIAQTGYSFLKSHDIINMQEGVRLVGILRDPFETILSHATMIFHYTKKYEIEHIIKEYVDFLRTMSTRNMTLVRYDQLISNTKTLIDRLLKELGLIKANSLKFGEIHDNKEQSHLASSLTSEHYEHMKTKLKEYDLSEAYFEYNLLLKNDMVLNCE